MRRHAKRSTAAPTPATANSGRFALALIAALCLALLTSTSASAAATPGYTGERFGCTPTAKCGDFESMTPERLAVNEANGDVYVIDSANDVVNRFDEDGNYLSQIKGSSTTVGSFGFNGNDDIAIDNSGGATQGRIYLATGFSKFFAFDAAGAFAWEEAVTDVCGIAVDASGEVFGSVWGGDIQQRDATNGDPVGSPIVTSAVYPDLCNLAFDSVDDLYVKLAGGNLHKFSASDGYVTDFQFPPGFQLRDIEVDRTSDRAYAVSTVQLFWFESDGNEAPDSGKTSDLPGIDYTGLTVNSATDRIYVADSGNSVIEIWEPLVKLTVIKNPTGSGTGEVKCDTGSGPEACKAKYAEGTELTVSAAPNAGSQLTSISATASAGSCAASPCTFTLNEDSEVFVKFDLVKHKLTVKKSGEGAVTSNPVGINCGKTCEATYNEGAKVKLTAAPATGWALGEWSGACTGTAATCEVTIAAAAEATATFVQLDSDGDGVPDNSDACPKEAGTQANGCPPPTNPGGGGSGGTGGGGVILPPPPPPVDNLGPCIAKATKAHQKAIKAAKAKKGKAKAKAIKAANKRKAKAIAACKAQFA